MPLRRRHTRSLLAAVLAAVAVCLSSCESATAPAFPNDAPPTAFSVTYWAFVYGSHDVTLRGDTLVVLRMRDYLPGQDTTVRVVPSRAEWQAFWRAADAAGVRGWPKECPRNDIVDGAAFALDISYAGGRVQAAGSNAFPRRDGKCAPAGEGSAEFRSFLDAVSTLIGRTYP